MPKRSEPRLPQEAPVRIFGMDSHGRPVSVASSTLDISKSGARLKEIRCWDYPGEIIGIRHGMEKARFRIIWVGAPGTPIDGQIGLQCIEAGRYIWGVAPPSSDSRPEPAHFAGMARTLNQVAMQPQAMTYPDRRRRDQRFAASGGVNVHEAGSNVPQWAMLHDISAGGCYVETTSPLAPLTRVDLTLQIGEMRIECKGSVTVKHPLVGMGIKFTDMTALNRERLQHVIESLEQETEQASGGTF
ncbi:MAG: PilZ domain-containing protein [Terriglobales bacterium]